MCCKGVKLGLSLKRRDQSENVSQQNSEEKKLDKTSTKTLWTNFYNMQLFNSYVIFEGRPKEADGWDM